MGMAKRVDAQDPVVAEADEEIHKPVQETAIPDFYFSMIRSTKTQAC